MRSLFASFVLLLLASSFVHSQVIFQEDFDSGTAQPYSGSAYYRDAVKTNGLVVQQSGGILVPDGSGFIFPNNLPNDVSGSGFYLFNGTDDPNPGASENQVWGSLGAIGVSPNTDHTFRFSLANVFTDSPASIQASINGTALGGGVSSTGEGNWQEFSFNWNSGVATTADLSLNNLNFSDLGNDFGIDAIRFEATAVPEPSQFLLFGMLAMAIGARRYGRRFSRPLRRS